jgi:hypothetical protein
MDGGGETSAFTLTGTARKKAHGEWEITTDIFGGPISDDTRAFYSEDFYDYLDGLLLND